MTSFSKFEIKGEHACAFLQYLAVADVDKPVGGAVYTQLCNKRGGIEADVTIIRRAEDCFWLVTGSALGVRDRDWIECNLHIFNQRTDRNWTSQGEQWRQNASDVQIRDITSAYGVINLAGPLARKVLEKVTKENVSHSGFPFMTAKDIRIGYAPALAYRVTYIGELGWELYIPTEYMAYAYEVLQQAGQKFGLINAGYRAIDSLRMEKQFLAWGVDITPDHNPFEAGLQFLIDWNKGDFVGREALSKINKDGVRKSWFALHLTTHCMFLAVKPSLQVGKSWRKALVETSSILSENLWCSATFHLKPLNEGISRSLHLVFVVKLR